MFRYTAAVALALMLGASAVTSAVVDRSSDRGTVLGADSQDVMPALGGGIEVHACRGVDENGPFDVVEFGPGVAGDVGGARVIVANAPAGSCAHLVVFTQPEPNQAL